MFSQRLNFSRRVGIRQYQRGCQDESWLFSVFLPACMTSPARVQFDRKEVRRLSRHLFSHRGTKQISSLLLSCKEALQCCRRVSLLRRGDGKGTLPTTATAAAPHVLRAAQPGGDGGRGPKDEEGKTNIGGGSDGSNVAGDDNANEDSLVECSVLFVLVMFLLSYVLYRLSQPSGKRTGWPSLIRNADAIESVHLYPNYAQVYTEKAKLFLGLVDDQHTQEKLDQLRAAYITAKANKEKQTGESSPTTLDVVVQGTPLAEQALVGLGVFAWVIPFVFFPVFVMILSNSIGKSLTATMEAGRRSQKVKDMVFRVEHTSNTRFHHIAGMKEPKREITEVVDFLRQPERYTSLGAKIPTGALLLGPPGTGKTLLAKAVAGESGVGFIPVCGSDFVELYVGMGALRVRQLFEVAKKQRCVVYIDEIDAIGLKRSGAGHGEKQEQEHTLNELLTQLDGFGSGKRGDVMILASSNVEQEMLDPALIRPGRFDRIIHVDNPVITERIDIFKVHLSSLKLMEDTKDTSASITAETTKDEENVSPDSQEPLDKTTVTTNPVSKEESHKCSETEGTVDITTGNSSAAETTASASSSASSSSKKEDPTLKTTNAAEAETKKCTASAITVSKLQEELDDEKQELKEEENASGHASFDFRSLLAKKPERERALINVYADRLSSLCPGFVGSDIANVCNEGAILAARENCKFVDITHLERSIDRVLAGIEHRSRVLTPFERDVVAHHEAGHAVAGWFLNRADPLMKVSIVPRGGSALGYAQYLPNENRMRTAAEIRDSISVTLGGRVAEKIFFNHLSTGASDDLRKVTQMAYMYVSSFAKRPVYPAPGTQTTRYVKPFGPKVSNELDVEAKKLVDEVYESTYKLLLSKKKEMETLARHLLQNEVLTYDDVVSYLGVRCARQSDRKKKS